MTAIEARPQNMALAAVTFDREQLDLIKTQIAPGASDGELALFVQQAKRTGLDPFSRQIYAVMREQSIKDGNQWTKVQKMTIQVAIDGFRLIAERTGKYAGQVGPEWCGADGKWVDVWLKKEAPSAARVGVLRSDFKEPLYGVARFDAYASKKQDGSLMGLWAKMPDVMIAKCAEAQALRRAFPNDLSGLYATEEMQQADNPAAPQEQPQARPVDVTRQIAQATNPNAALEAWVGKIGEAGTKINGLGGRERAVAALAHFPDWRRDVEQAKAAYEALCEVGRQIKQEQDQAQAEEPPFDVVSSGVYLINAQQLKVLQAHMGRVLPKAESQQRHAFYHWYRPLDVPAVTATNDLTEMQAQALIDALGKLDNDSAQQTGAEFEREYAQGLLG